MVIYRTARYLMVALLMTQFSFNTIARESNDKGLKRTGQNFISNRVALVIGNQNYPKAPLNNPVNDAQDMKAALEQVGFRVIYRENANLQEIKAAVREFAKGLGHGTIALFYFSGHGAQTDGYNYLVPADSDINSESELKYGAYNVNIILSEMEKAQDRLNILILDACRNNPFKGIKGEPDGLATLTGPKGSLIAFATAPGATAADYGRGRNSVYTGYLKQYLVQPGLKIEEMFKRVRESVIADNPKQVPWENLSITGDFCFAGCGESQRVSTIDSPHSAPADSDSHPENATNSNSDPLKAPNENEVDYRRLASPTFAKDYVGKTVTFQAKYFGEGVAGCGHNFSDRMLLNLRSISGVAVETGDSSMNALLTAAASFQCPDFPITIEKEKADVVYNLHPGEIVTVTGAVEAYQSIYGQGHAPIHVKILQIQHN